MLILSSNAATTMEARLSSNELSDKTLSDYLLGRTQTN